jgi:fibronectin-binding autotransporter adhesin
MNITFTSVWNATLGAWVAASEITRARGKRSSGRAATSGARNTAALFLTAGLCAVAPPSWAVCLPVGGVVNCVGPANLLSPSYSSALDNQTVNVNSGATVGVLLGAGGTAMFLSGDNVRLNNSGTIDVGLMGPPSGSSIGVQMGSASASNRTIFNDGTIRGGRGPFGTPLGGLDGVAVDMQNAGASQITNAGLIDTGLIAGAPLATSSADAPVIAVYGKGVISFTNTSTGIVVGRIGFDGGAGNTFVNAGTLHGSLSMGGGVSNTFAAVTGSVVDMGDSAGAPQLAVTGMDLAFAPAGFVDGGAAGNNTLRLQNAASGGDATATGTGALAMDKYLNFQHVAVTGGTWALSGAATLATADFKFSGGLVQFSAATAFGAANLIGGGGAIEPTADGIVLANAVSLPGRLTVRGARDLTLSGAIAGAARLIQDGTGITRVTGDNPGLQAAAVASGTMLATGNGLVNASTTVDDTKGNNATLQLASGAVTGHVIVNNGGVLTNAGTVGVPGIGYGVQGAAGTATVNNSGTVYGHLAMPLDTGGTVNNSGGSIIGVDRGIQTQTATSTLNNTLGGSVRASGYAAVFFAGGTVLNSGGSSIVSTNDLGLAIIGNANVTNTAGSTISGSIGIVVQGGTSNISNAGQINGGVNLNTGKANQVTLHSGGQIAGYLSIGSVPGSTLTLDGTGSQAYSDAVTGATTFGGDLVKAGSGTWTIDRPLAPVTATINAGTLALGAGGNLALTTAVNIAAAGASFDIGAGGAQTIGDLQGVAGSGLALGAKRLTFGTAADTVLASTVTGSGTLVKNGTGTLALNGNNSGFSGGLTANAGRVDIAAANALGTGALTIGGNVALGTPGAMTLANDVTLNAGSRLSLANASALTLAGNVTGGGALVKDGAGVLSLVGAASSFQGGTTLNAGTLRLGSNVALGSGALTVGGAATLDGSTALSLANDMVLNATLTLASSDVLALGGKLTGTGPLVKNGASALVLTQGSLYTGGTTVNSGTLSVMNTAGSATGASAVQVNSGAQLTGSGSIAGPVAIAGGARLSVGNGVSAMRTGALTLAAGSNIDFDLGQAGMAGGPLNDLLNVDGNLVLGGSVNVTQSAGGVFGAGLYRLINYTGTLTDNGIAIGTAPVAASNLVLQTSVANQVNLINTSGLVLNMWDGGNSANYNDSKVSGGSGTWRAGTPADGWTDVAGSANAPWAQGGFAVFGGTAGTVTVDNKGAGGAVRIGGAQFATDGYTVVGDPLTITTAGTNLRVGDGTAASAGMTATISSKITGAGGIAKEDGGTLVLGGANDYTGGTTVHGGVLQISADTNLGAASGGLTLDGGALRIAGAAGPVTSNRAITLGISGGMLDVAGSVFGAVGGITGPGALTVTGKGGTLAVATPNDYIGGTVLQGGATISVGTGGTLGTGPVQQQGNGTRLVFANAADAGANSYTVGRAGGTDGGNLLAFAGASTAGTAKLAVNGAGWQAADANSLSFGDTSTAAGATVANLGGSVNFLQGSSAGSATIVNGDKSLVGFTNAASAGSAKIDNLSGGTVYFADTASAAKATIANAQGGTLDVSGVTAKGGFEVGALSGAGAVVLGATQLTLGRANGNDVIAGAVSDKGSQFAQPGAGTGGAIVKVGSGTLTLSGANSYTGGTALRQGRLNVGHSQALGTGALTMDDDTTLGFSADHVTIANAIRLTGQNDPVIDTGAFDGALSGGISGGGFITKQGTGTLTLSGANTYTGATNVAQGTLKAGAVNTLSAASAHSVASGATLDLAGLSQSVASLANSGTVSLAGATAGATLTVNGNYAGNNGVLRLGTALSGTGPSDRLVINGGTATGKTSVQVANLGGLGALTVGNGIEVISAQSGATTTAQTTKDAFALAGGHVDAGAYEYRLYAADASGAGENWFLRSSTNAATPPGVPGTPGTPGVPVVTYRAEASLYAALPSQLRQGSLAMLGDVRKRVGDDDVKGGATLQAGPDRRAWARVLSADIDIQQGGAVSPKSKGRLTGFQAGTDLLATPNWRAGIYVGQLDGDARVNGFASGIQNLGVGRNDLRSQYVGVYGTYTGDSGFYADAVVQSGRHRYTVEPLASAGVGGKGNSLLGSIEVGQAFAIGGSGWTVEPQLQLIHHHMDLNNSAIAGAIAQPQADSGWIARAGVRVKGQIDTGMGTLQPYGRFNVYKTSSGTDIARFVNGATTTDIAAPTGGTSAELAGGFTLALSQSTSLYGEVGKLWSSGGDAKVKSSINGSLGVRVKW